MTSDDEIKQDTEVTAPPQGCSLQNLVKFQSSQSQFKLTKHLGSKSAIAITRFSQVGCSWVNETEYIYDKYRLM